MSTPGRNVFYLVRDGALPTRPLIGIAALGNPVLGLSQRDDYLGWSATGLQQKLSEWDDHKVCSMSNRIVSSLFSSIDETYRRDFNIPTDPLKDTNQSLALLSEIEQSSLAERRRSTDRTGESLAEDRWLIGQAQNAIATGRPETIDWEEIAETPLYRRKRAKSLIETYRALDALTRFGFTHTSGDLPNALSDPAAKKQSMSRFAESSKKCSHPP